MKIVMKKSSIEFNPSYPEGTEISVTPVFEGTYAIGNGYYLTNLGTILFFDKYLGYPTGVSNLISVVGYSKIKASNLVAASYQGVLSFFNSEEQTQGTSTVVFSGTEPGSLDITIPEGSLYIRVGANISGSGGQPLGPAVIKLVV